MLVLKGLVDLQRTSQLQLLHITGLGIDLDYCYIEWFALEMKRVILSFWGLYPSTTFWTLLLTMMATPFLLRDYCPQY